MSGTGRPRSYNTERVGVSFRLPVELHARLVEAARDRDLSTNLLACKAIEDYLGRLIPADELRLTRPAVDR